MAVSAQTLGPGILTITPDGGGTAKDLSAQITACELEVSTDTDDAIDVLSGEQIDGDTTESFQLNVTFLQDLAASGCIDWSWTNAGKSAVFSFTPNTTTGLRKVGGALRIRRLSIGGDVKKKNTTDVEFSIIGVPTLTAVV